MKNFKAKLLLFSIIGLLLIIAGISYGSRANDKAQQVTRLSRITPMSVVVLKDTQLGSEVLIEGKISPETDHNQYNLVAYIYEEYESGDDGGWEVKKRHKPPLIVSVGDDYIRVTNSNYDMALIPVMKKIGDKRYKGIMTNDPVLIVGELVQNQSSVGVKASVVARGQKSAYLSYARGQVKSARALGFSLIVTGIFALILTAIWAIYQVALASVPKPTLTVTPQNVRIGGQPAQVTWQFAEKTDKLKRFVIELHGEEKAENTSGSSISHYKRKFACIKVVEVKATEGHIASGRCDLQVPAGLLPSFESMHNRVVWTIQTQTKIRWRPIAKHTFDLIKVQPPLIDPSISKSALASKGSVSANANIRLNENRTHFLPGEDVSGTFSWERSVPGEKVELRLCWKTQGKGNQDMGVVARESCDMNQNSGTNAFHFKLPDSPISFSGKFISVSWALELANLPPSASQKRKLFSTKPKENVQSLPLVVSPLAEEITYQLQYYDL